MTHEAWYCIVAATIVLASWLIIYIESLMTETQEGSFHESGLPISALMVRLN